MKLKRTVFILGSIGAIGLFSALAAGQSFSGDSCSTFLLSGPGGKSTGSMKYTVVGHDLDDYIPVPGMIVINRRGCEKSGIAWKDITAGWSDKRNHVTWTSTYGSVTYNTLGREFCDGGMNEAGFYVGEMTLAGTKYPKDPSLPAIYHHQWMQRLLDTCATVNEALDAIKSVRIDGLCTWHFFMADKSGDAAVVEFIKEQMIVYHGDSLPVPILANSSYEEDIANLRRYDFEGKGGLPVDINDKEHTKRFVRGTVELMKYNADGALRASITPESYVFGMCDSLDVGNNKWQVVCDLVNLTFSVRTYLDKEIKTLSLSSLDFTVQPPMYRDIHKTGTGDISKQFAPLDAKTNLAYIRTFWKGVNLGFPWNFLVKPLWVWGYGGRMAEYGMKYSKP